ncbi:hypothetical protein BTI_4394 [Burkholderia thailandensis MSMB121]|uniref:Uncharacterized protein n=2 Tax=Burkholderia humptydooensis TaxID=430531 RepID=A0A7U4P8S4_9BURK|nr:MULTISPECIES: hypothetical protein [Burkholderia]AGK51090.1 hypothetical protein BTI_4394 [Burkholderia thailandensis MSMB121]ATF32079.1 hypothetical protein CO709_00550 [Burkholderia thailandensis]AJY40625.1 hypothetical protein BW21_3927 [Burkholderia sp. 2002721687]ALX45052.1 hypothetical protein AQ610_21265 [Burkholderia humptydooensis]EIP85119.1 hypothetical protein A33K_18068 [Burkholderia humptydooensis MSMB43]
MSAVDTSAAVRPAAPPTKPKTMLRRLLSHHEIATLLILLHAPIGANAKPELPALQEAGLVEMIRSDMDAAPSFRLTEDGNAVLKGLGYR